MTTTIIEMIQLHVFRQTPDDGIEHLLIKRAVDEPVFPNVWQVITGYIEESEKAWEAALRELEEETGLTAEHLWVIPHVGSFYNPQKDCIELIPIFAAEVKHDAMVHLSHEHQEYRWLSKEEAIAMSVFASHKQGISSFHEFIRKDMNGEHVSKLF